MPSRVGWRPQQLRLFATDPVTPNRPKKGRSHIEFRLQCKVADQLARFALPQWRYSHLPFGEKRDSTTASRLKRMGTTPGWPDFILVRRAGEGIGGKVCFLELKRPGEKLSADPANPQLDIAVHLMAAGCGYCWVDNYNDACQALADWGVFRPGVHW